MKITSQQETLIRIGALVLPAVLVMMWISDVAGDGDFAMAGLGGLTAAIMIGLGYFFFHKRSLKVQVMASVAVTVLLMVAIRLFLDTQTQKLKREILGHWESVPREDELDEPMTMWFETSQHVQVGFEDPHLCAYEIRKGNLVLIENGRSSTMKIVRLRNDSLLLEGKEEERILFVRAERD